MLCKKGILENFTKFTGKHLCQSPEACNFFYKRHSGTGVFLWILRNVQEHLFYRTLPVAASEGICRLWFNSASIRFARRWNTDHFRGTGNIYKFRRWRALQQSLTTKSSSLLLQCSPSKMFEGVLANPLHLTNPLFSIHVWFDLLEAYSEPVTDLRWSFSWK